jgi:hypothetical protein
MKKFPLLMLVLAGCVEMVSVNRAMSAAPREANCELALVQADMMELSPMGTKWDYLGTVSIGANHGMDPASKEVREMIRPKACELGGTAVALMQANSASMVMGSNSAIIYAVLRPKQAAAGPTAF